MYNLRVIYPRDSPVPCRMIINPSRPSNYNQTNINIRHLVVCRRHFALSHQPSGADHVLFGCGDSVWDIHRERDGGFNGVVAIDRSKTLDRGIRRCAMWVRWATLLIPGWWWCGKQGSGVNPEKDAWSEERYRVPRPQFVSEEAHSTCVGRAGCRNARWLFMCFEWAWWDVSTPDIVPHNYLFFHVSLLVIWASYATDWTDTIYIYILIAAVQVR